MRRFRSALLAVLGIVPLSGSGVAAADPAAPAPAPPAAEARPEEKDNLPGDGGKVQKALREARKNFGLEALEEWRKIAKFIIIILGAALLGAVLAYHPFASHGASVEDLEQPKIIITYTVVGALIAIIVTAIPEMAFAIFGIGGLMRFRTELGAAKETGRVILATVLGLCCGLEFWMAALVGTALAWILIYILESRVNERLLVRGLRSENLNGVADAYAKALREIKCSFGAPRKNPSKGQVSFNIQHRRGMDREGIEARLNAEVPKELKGTIDWPED